MELGTRSSAMGVHKDGNRKVFQFHQLVHSYIKIKLVRVVLFVIVVYQITRIWKPECPELEWLLGMPYNQVT